MTGGFVTLGIASGSFLAVRNDAGGGCSLADCADVRVCAYTDFDSQPSTSVNHHLSSLFGQRPTINVQLPPQRATLIYPQPSFCLVMISKMPSGTVSMPSISWLLSIL